MRKGKNFRRMAGTVLAAALLFSACGQKAGNAGKEEDAPVYGEEGFTQAAELSMSGLQAKMPGSGNPQTVISADSVISTRLTSSTSSTSSIEPVVSVTSGGLVDDRGNGQMELTTDKLATEKVTTNKVTTKDGELPIDETYFPDAAFRDYIRAYVDKDRNNRLSQYERNALRGLGSVKCMGGLSDGGYLADGVGRAEKLRAIKSLEGIEYFENLEEIYFEGAYELQKLPLNNPKLKSVYVKCSSVQEFSIENGEELTSLSYRIQGIAQMPWKTFTKLANLEVAEEEISLVDLFACKELQSISLEGCNLDLSGFLGTDTLRKLTALSLNYCTLSVPEGLESLDFKCFPELQEFYYSAMKGKDCILVKELLFQDNSWLKQITFESKIADRIVLPNMDVYFEIPEDFAGCEILFAEELLLDTGKTLPWGSVWLTAQNFPDPLWRQYLYEYADQDRNLILTDLELRSVRELSAENDQYLSNIRRLKSETQLKRIQSFQGIEYLENLRVLRLNEGAAVKELHLNNPRLTELLLPSTLTMFSIENPDNLIRLTFHSRAGMELDLGGMYALEEVNLTNITADFSKLLQNRNLNRVRLVNCTNLGGKLEMLDFSGHRGLEHLTVVMGEGQDESWADSIRFGSENSYTGSGSIYLEGNVTKTLILPKQGFECQIEGDASECEIVYQ
ncbi:MAG: hypothetical protein K2N63_02850 [Lachnospiraceae bacterium]|nr:hypothetical protein [Lachnospiraceae bacterium]